MGKKKKNKPAQTGVPGTISTKTVAVRTAKKPLWPWVLTILAITAICFWPMLQNGFTNWDDEGYVLKNKLLAGPDWNGIFSQPVVGNYHPLTIISLAINYSISGTDASSYLLFNYILHLVNCALVFYFIFQISGKKVYVAFFAALIFGIHPMHVESVAWVSERKDVLYTFFYLLSLISYWGYLQTGKKVKYGMSFLFFILSLLSKPAAIVLPLVLLLLDYWKGRPLNRKVFLEKLPFFLFALLVAIITLKIQSTNAVVKLDSYPLWTRPVFFSYVIIIYLVRFLFPYPLSAFHPFPQINSMGWEYIVCPLLFVGMLFMLWRFRKNKLIVFCFLFFIINLFLVAQLVSIGSSIVSERYTYVPYISIAFLIGMLISQIKSTSVKKSLIVTSTAVILIFGIISFQRISVWKNSGTLWSNVITHYPGAPIPRTNRANYDITQAVDPANKDRAIEIYNEALEDCNVALKNKPDDVEALANRQNIYLNLNNDSLAIADADRLVKVAPENKTAYYIRGVVHVHKNEPGLALSEFNKCLLLDPNNDYALAFRAYVFYNFYKNYKDAITDYSKIIDQNLNPQAYHYLNRSYCYFNLADTLHAKIDAQTALQKGAAIPDTYRKLINL
jgi:hypothetical protein